MVSKTDKAEEVYDVDWAASELDQEQVFLLSAKEAHDYLSKYDNVAELEATYKNENSGSWWLRSPYADSQYEDQAGFVAPNGIVWNRWAGAWYAARPAFNLDIDSILFSSAAKGGKSSGAVANGALQEIASNDTSEWKLTLKDSSRASFTAKVNDESEATKAEAYEDDWVIDIEYEGAQAGDNEYVSALLCDEDGNALYYGNIAKGSTSGTAGVKIPSGLSAGTYTLNVFSEQCNGDKMTDYASDFQEIKLTVKHVFGEWEITKEMTETDSGEMIRVCQVCGYEETAEIPMISSGNPGTEASADSTAATNGNDQTAVNTDANAEEPATGDESNMLFFIILAGLSAAGCATVIIRRRSDFGSGRKTER